MTQMNQPGSGQPIPPPQLPPTMPPGYPPPGGYPQQGYGPPPKKGMSGGMIALIVIGALILVLAIPCSIALFLPNLGHAREMAIRMKCSANLKQIGAALVMYSSSNKGDYPESMARLVEISGVPATALVCPDSTDTPLVSPGSNLTDARKLVGHCSYIYVGKGWKESTAGADTVLVYEPLDRSSWQGN